MQKNSKFLTKHTAVIENFVLISMILVYFLVIKEIITLDELKERLIAVWSDFQQDIIDTASDQWRKRLKACVRANGGHFEHLP